MILIPYSKTSYRTNHSIDAIKDLLVENAGINTGNDNSIINKNLFSRYKGEISGNDFKIIEKQIGKDIWTLRIKGQLKSEKEKTNVTTVVILNYTSWILFLIISLFNLGLITGIFIYSRISGELNPIVWDLLLGNLFFYIIYLTVYHLKKYRNDKFLRKILDAEKIK